MFVFLCFSFKSECFSCILAKLYASLTILSLAISIYTIQYYEGSVSKALTGVILFIIFILSWIPLNIQCIFSKKELKWVQIKHDRNVEVGDLIK